MRRILLGFAACACAACFVWGQDTEDKPVIKHGAAASFAAMPGLPDCATIAPQRGDPSKGPAAALVKMDSTCVVPWHWHSVNETVIPVAGLLQVTAQGGKPQVLAIGDYGYMPAKHIHQAKCASSKPCTFFLEADGPFDLHYVDKSGTEIPAEKALADVNKPPAKPGAKP